MAGSFNDQSQVVVARKVHPSGKVFSAGSGNGPAAGAGGPSIEPAGGLQASGLILNPEGIAQLGQDGCGGLLPRQRGLQQFAVQLTA